MDRILNIDTMIGESAPELRDKFRAEGLGMCRALKKSYKLSDANMPQAISLNKDNEMEVQLEESPIADKKNGVVAIAALMYLFNLPASTLTDKKMQSLFAKL